MQPVKSISREGQPFVDEPVYITISDARKLALRVNGMFARQRVFYLHAKKLVLSIQASLPLPRQIEPRLPVFLEPNPRLTSSIEEFSHYNRVTLRWMKPDGKGGLIPKYEGARA
jgi:hypothetical protein